MAVDQIPLHELLRLCLDSDDQAQWCEFVSRTQPLIASVVRRRLSSWMTPLPSLVDDLTQDTYLKLAHNNFSALRNFKCDNETPLYGYIKKAACNVVEDERRRHRVPAPEPLPEIDPQVPNGERRAEEAVFSAEVDEFLKKHAPERDRRIFWLYYRQGLTSEAISRLPGIALTVDGVESTLHRLRRQLRDWGKPVV